MLMRTAPSRRASERGQALLATLFVLGFLGLLTIAMLGYASSTQGQYARTEQTARQNASIEGAVDAGLVTAARYYSTSLSSCSGTPTGSMTFPAGANGAAQQFFPSTQTVNFTYKNCYPNGAASGASGGAAGHGVLQPACVVCTLFNIPGSLTVGGGSTFTVAGPIWANDSIIVNGAGSVLKSTDVTWKPMPSTCSSDPGMLCVGGSPGSSSGCPPSTCLPNWPPKGNLGAPPDPLTGFETPPPLPSPRLFKSSGTTSFTALSAKDKTNPATAANSYVGESITAIASGSTGVITANDTTGGFTLTAAGWQGGTPAANASFIVGQIGAPFVSSGTTTYTATRAKDTANPTTVAGYYVGASITAGASTGVITANDTTGGFTVGSWTGGTPSANTKFVVGANYSYSSGAALPLGQRVFSNVQISSGTTVLPGGTYIIEEPSGGNNLVVTSHAILTAHVPFTSSSTTTFTTSGAKDTSTTPTPTTVLNGYVGTKITAGASSGTILTNDAAGGFTLTASGWTGGTPAANTQFSVATGPFSSSGTTTFTGTGAKDASVPATVASSYVGARVTAGTSTGVVTANDTTGGFTVGGGWTGGTPAANNPFNVSAPGPTDGSAITSSGTTTFTATSAKDTSNPATLTNSYVGAEITAGASKGIVTANDTTGGFTVAGGWTGGPPTANTVFYTGGVTLFITCSGYNGTSFSCPASYQTTGNGVIGGNTSTFLNVTGQGQLDLNPPTTFPETVIFEDPTVGGKLAISSVGAGIPGTIYAPDAQVSVSGHSGGNYGLIVVGSANVSGGACGGCAGAFGTIPGIGIVAGGTCPTFDVTATANNVSSQYGRALVQTQQCPSPSNTLGIVNFSYQGGTPP